MLEKKGYKVDSVSNSVDCYRALESNNKIYSILLVNENLAAGGSTTSSSGGNKASDAVSIGMWIRQHELSMNRQVKLRILVMVRNNILSIDYHAYEETEVDGFLPLPLEGSKLLPCVKKATSSYVESERIVEEEKVRRKRIVDANVKAVLEQEHDKDIEAKKKKKEQEQKKANRLSSSKKHSMVKGQLSSGKLKKKELVAFESEFQYDEKTSFPYAILENCSDESTSSAGTNTTQPQPQQQQTNPWCNLIVCQDVFDTYERFKIFFYPWYLDMLG